MRIGPEVEKSFVGKIEWYQLRGMAYLRQWFGEIDTRGEPQKEKCNAHIHTRTNIQNQNIPVSAGVYIPDLKMLLHLQYSMSYL